eukprot:CAMPEP_0175970240 /NCGR_PEP_ID=MMETSP0108-20121206/40935_1 /TAXON_ID=195067 ORGANISM="Goniomonas pacifica, Strain CCMP1869" /NCGR_SAMPLE_ID=MMETSP0108 /ASSEMBLY_ACC=CAM_ASM_000204 /LENGTH=81 /DNA_ID=CAMNT_0017299167 /DNA_START=178 /DNA_END=423 /DNA_ORIENTATION=+
MIDGGEAELCCQALESLDVNGEGDELELEDDSPCEIKVDAEQAAGCEPVGSRAAGGVKRRGVDSSEVLAKVVGKDASVKTC